MNESDSELAAGSEWLLAEDRSPAEMLSVVREALADYFTLAPGQPSYGERVYYDTFDGLFAAAGLTLSLGAGELTLASRDARAGGVLVTGSLAGAAPSPLVVAGLADSRLRAAVGAVAGTRVALELARISLTQQPVAVLDPLEKTVARLTLLVPAGLRTRLRVTPLRGYEAELGRVQALLSLSPELAAAEAPLVDEAARAAGREPGGISAAVSVAMMPDEPAPLAVARVLRALSRVYQANLPGALANLDSEFLHDLRVTLRRIRTVVRECHVVLSDAHYRWLRHELRWLQQVTGPSRDLDVYLEDLPGFAKLVVAPLRGELAPLEAVLRERQALARVELERDLYSRRAQTLADDWRKLLDALPGDGDEGAGVGAADGGELTIGALAGERILRLHRRMVKLGQAIDAGSPPDEYHELRKQGKELRYMLELFGRPLFDPEVIRPLVAALKGLQDVLGRHQDREVQAQMLLELAPAASLRSPSAGTLLAIGALIQRFETDAAAARGEFREQFDRFASRDQRALVKETFSA